MAFAKYTFVLTNQQIRIKLLWSSGKIPKSCGQRVEESEAKVIMERYKFQRSRRKGKIYREKNHWCRKS